MDQDGVADLVDARPTEPEDHHAPEPDDGYPIVIQIVFLTRTTVARTPPRTGTASTIGTGEIHIDSSPTAAER